MSVQPEQIAIYHITDVDNLQGILADGGLLSDAGMEARNPTVIGYPHIKERRLREYRIPCCNNRFVGEFVPFYYCPRSPMLYAINRGNTGRPQGCQRSIVHLVSTLSIGLALQSAWAVSDGNAGAASTLFDNTLAAVEQLNWPAIRATDWRGITHQKSAEFLVENFFPWTGFTKIGCYDQAVAAHVAGVLNGHAHRPIVTVEPEWYYQK